MERVHQFADHAPRLRLILSGHGTGEVTLCSRVLDHRRIVVRRSRACMPLRCSAGAESDSERLRIWSRIVYRDASFA